MSTGTELSPWQAREAERHGAQMEAHAKQVEMFEATKRQAVAGLANNEASRAANEAHSAASQSQKAFFDFMLNWATEARAGGAQFRTEVIATAPAPKAKRKAARKRPTS